VNGGGKRGVKFLGKVGKTGRIERSFGGHGQRELTNSSSWYATSDALTNWRGGEVLTPTARKNLFAASVESSKGFKSRRSVKA